MHSVRNRLIYINENFIQSMERSSHFLFFLQVFVFSVFYCRTYSISLLPSLPPFLHPHPPTPASVLSYEAFYTAHPLLLYHVRSTLKRLPGLYFKLPLYRLNLLSFLIRHTKHHRSLPPSYSPPTYGAAPSWLLRETSLWIYTPTGIYLST